VCSFRTQSFLYFSKTLADPMVSAHNISSLKTMLRNPLFHKLALWTALAAPLFAQSYTTTTIAGTSRLLDGHAANTVPLRYPYGMAQDAAGNVYFADSDDYRIRKVDTNGIISTVAGNGIEGYSGDGGPAIAAE
jgi:hypothetical protein